MAKREFLRVSVLAFATLYGCACHRTQPRDDGSITKQIQVTLYQDATLKRRDISVVVQGGVVVLIGQVSSENEKVSAERLAASAEGVKQVVNQLVVVGDSSRPVAPEQEAPAPVRSKGPG